MKTNMFQWLAGCFTFMASGALFAGSLIEYTQLTSLQSQPASNAVNLASLETVDGIQNIGSALNKITVKDSGYYFVIAAGQVGAVTSTSAGGTVDLWFVKNGTALPNTGSRASVSSQLTSVIVCQTIVPLNAGDSISVGFGASNPAFGLVAIPSANGRPAITSMTFTIYRLS